VLPVDSFLGYEIPWVLVFPFPADPFCRPGCSSCCGLISGFRASEAHPGVGFLTCRPSCCFFYRFPFLPVCTCSAGICFPHFSPVLNPSHSQDNHPVQIFCKPSCCCFGVVSLPLVSLLLLVLRFLLFRLVQLPLC
jgi:hypothetical protein